MKLFGLLEQNKAIEVCVDFDKEACRVVKANFPQLPYINDDIKNVDARRLREEGGIKAGIDIIIGGPPCQPFSKSGLRKGLNDGRSETLTYYIKLIESLQPRAFVLENVRGLFSSRGGKDLEDVLNRFSETGYKVYSKILDAANYGVPQFRQRLFLIGFKEHIKFDFPDITNMAPEEAALDRRYKPFATVFDAIKDLQGKVKGMPYRGKYSPLLPEIPEGLNYSYYCKERGHSEPKFEWRSKFWYFLLKTDRNKPSLTIQAYPGNNTGPFHWENRRFDIEELKRLQTFPDWFEMPCSYTVAHRLIGNAVPPLLAMRIGIAIREALENPDQKEENSSWGFSNGPKALSGYCLSGRGSGKGKIVVRGGKAHLSRADGGIEKAKQMTLPGF